MKFIKKAMSILLSALVLVGVLTVGAVNMTEVNAVTYKGIDVSEHQGTIDFAKVKSSGLVDFVVIREGYRQTVDKQFTNNVQGFKNSGVNIKGVYHFSYALNVEQAKQEAQFCIQQVQNAGLGKDVIIFFDFEYDTVTKAKNQGVTLGYNECNAHTKAFCEYVESQGYRAGIYANIDYYKNMYDKNLLNKYVFWLADYSGSADYACAYHQYSSTGSIPGITGNVDLDYCFDSSSSTSSSTSSANVRSRSAVVSLVQSWLGKNEADGSYKSIIDIYNSYKGTFPRGIKMDYSWAWCACTWSAAAIKLGYTDIMPIEISCYYIIEEAKKKGCWVENDAYVPKPADAVLYDWEDSGSGDNQGMPDHIGTVETVNTANGTFTVIEGNYSNSVKRRTMKINGQFIRGFICPKYNADDGGSVVPEKKSVTEVAQEVISGLWGYGEDRRKALTEAGYDYDAVQERVNELLGVAPPKTVDQLAEEVFDGKWGIGAEREKGLKDAGYDYDAVQKRINELIAEANTAVVTLSKDTLSLEKGKSQTITATVTPQNAANKNITWDSSDDQVATVSDNGKITAVGVGTAVITATAYTKTATCTVTVPALANKSKISSDSITLGESITITAKASGGMAPYTYTYSYKKSTDTTWEAIVKNTTETSVTFKPETAETYDVRVIAKDSDGTTKKRLFILNVEKPVEALANNSTLSATSITLGDSITINGKASGGTSPYTYKFESKHSTSSSYHVIQDFSSTATTSWLPGKTGTYTIRITVKDKAGKTAAKSFTLTVKDATLTNSSTISSTSVNFGKSITLTGKASGGTSPYTYKFESKHSTSSRYHVIKDFSSTATTSWLPGKTGTYTVRITVKDKAGKTASKTFTLTVKSELQNNSKISATSIKLGSSVKVTGSATGGTAPYKYSYYYKKSTSSSWTVKAENTTSTSVTITPGAAVSYDIKIIVTDSNATVADIIYTVNVQG